MNFENLKENYHKLISHLENECYDRKYVKFFRAEIENIIQLANSGNIMSYADVYRKYELSGCVYNTLRTKRNAIGAIKAFDLYGKYPDGNHSHPLFHKAAHHLINAEYKEIVNYYTVNEEKRGKNKRTIYYEMSNAATLLLKLQQSGIESLEGATENNILSLFIDQDGKITKQYDCKVKFARFLKTCAANFPECGRVLAFLPAFKKKHKNIQFLTTEEYNKVREVLLNDTSGLTLRNRAIGIIALYTGLRSGDIASMKLSSVDWETDTLNIQQRKTTAPLTLPLSAIVGNAIWDYIELERPKTDCEYIFTSKNRPYGRLYGLSSMGHVAERILKAANIRQNAGDRKGFHIFRHHLATKLLENGISRPIISSIIGQTDPKSLNSYLSADFVHLKECAISIEQFPVHPEVFGE